MRPEPGSDLTARIIGLAIQVHRALGPGLLESVYSQCLVWEFQQHGLCAEREVPLPLVYQGHRLEKSFQADIIVERTVLIEIKTVEHILPLREAQTRTYLRLSNCEIALLMNFNTQMLKDGLRRFIP
jgi:GxxExxY protein